MLPYNQNSVLRPALSSQEQDPAVLAFKESPQGARLFESGTALELLSRANELCHEELRALKHGYINVAAANSSVRSELINLAQMRHNTSETNSLRKAYEALQECIDSVRTEAFNLRKKVQNSMNSVKQKGKRVSAYKKIAYL